MAIQQRIAGAARLLAWEDLQLVLTVSRVGSLTGAARLLGISQPTAGRRLTEFEARLGFPIFDRKTTGLEPTLVGQSLIANLREMESYALAFERQASAREQEQETLTIACLDWVANWLLGAIAGRFSKLHPKIAVDLSVSHRRRSLSRREADLAVRFAPFDQLDLVQRKIGFLSSGLFASKEYLSTRDPIDFSNGLRGHTLVTLPRSYSYVADHQWLLAVASNATVGLRSNSLDAHLRAAEVGAGIAVLPKIMGSNTANLSEIASPGGIPGREVWVGFHRDLRRAERVTAFVKFLSGELHGWSYIDGRAPR